MGWGTNQKVIEKRQKEANKKKEAQKQREQKKEKEKWKDDYTEKKLEEAQQKEQKRIQELARKKQLKELAQKEARQLEKQSKKVKGQFAEKKLTQAQIQERVQRANQIRQQDQEYPEQNTNRNLDGVELANTLDAALEIFDDSQQRHPERRFKAAFQAFCEKRDPILKIDYPKLKRSQRIQMIRKQFQKHPDNPYNKKNIIAYNHNPRKQEKQEKEE